MSAMTMCMSPKFVNEPHIAKKKNTDLRNQKVNQVRVPCNSIL